MAIATHAAPASAPVNVRATAISSVEIFVTWEEVLPDDQNGIIITYEVVYEPLETFDGVLMPVAINTTNMYLLLTDLHSFVDYSISVSAYTSVGAGPNGTVIERTYEDRKFIMVSLKCSY